MMRVVLAAAAGGLLVMSAVPTALGQDDESATAARKAMVEVIRAHAQASAEVTGRDELDPRVLEAMTDVPRHEFVPSELKAYSYLDTALPIGHEQSISQPFIIALMIDLGAVEPDDIVFETGTGAGYQAAVLGELAREVYSIEVIQPLAERAARILKRLGYGNVNVKFADGYFGWKETGPFDVILLKEAVDHIPPPLLRQLKPGGRMVLPLGGASKAGDVPASQMLTVIRKEDDGNVSKTPVLPVRFTPLQGGKRI